MKIRDAIKAELTTRVLVHTSAALGGVLTWAGVQPQNGISVDDMSTALAGIALQTATVAVGQLISKIRARRARKREYAAILKVANETVAQP